MASRYSDEMKRVATMRALSYSAQKRMESYCLALMRTAWRKLV